MNCQEATCLEQIVSEQAERLSSVQEQVNRARCALLDHDLERVRYWLAQIEETSHTLTSLSPSLQTTRR